MGKIADVGFIFGAVGFAGLFISHIPIGLWDNIYKED